MIRKPQEYIESLNDGRVTYYLGEQVPDVTKQPLLRGSINRAALDWVMANDARYRDLVTEVDEDGERVNFLWRQPRTAEELLRQRDIFVLSCRIGFGIGQNCHAMGVHAFLAAGVVAAKMDKKIGTHYMDAVESYRRYLQKKDIALTGAITDPKGDRGLHPSMQKQHKDFYVRVVDKRKDGIVVRGAKMHISAIATCNEVIVSPCRAHREEDKDYAVVFATPLNAKGITCIHMPMTANAAGGEEADWDYPLHGNTATTTETLLVFDDVFVPWEKVFMCGEWQFSRDIAWAFGTYHRLYSISHTVAESELITGAACLIAEYNGLEKYGHIQDKLAWLAMYAEETDVLSKAACSYPDVDPETGLAVPNLVYTNIAKYKFANERSEALKILADIAGGIASTVPCYKDWKNSNVRKYLDKYLAAKDGVPTEHRLRVIRMVKELTVGGGYGTAAVMNAEGSLAAQKMAIYKGSDWERYKAAAKRLARIPGWEDHSLFKGVPDPRKPGYWE